MKNKLLKSIRGYISTETIIIFWIILCLAIFTIMAFQNKSSTIIDKSMLEVDKATIAYGVKDPAKQGVGINVVDVITINTDVLSVPVGNPVAISGTIKGKTGKPVPEDTKVTVVTTLNGSKTTYTTSANEGEFSFTYIPSKEGNLNLNVTDRIGTVSSQIKNVVVTELVQ